MGSLLYCYRNGGKRGLATKGTKGTKGVQLAIARSMASNMCRGDAPVLAQRYKRQDARGERGGLLTSCLSPLTFLGDALVLVQRYKT